MIETMAKILAMFGVIIISGLGLVLLNDGLEYLWQHFKLASRVKPVTLSKNLEATYPLGSKLIGLRLTSSKLTELRTASKFKVYQIPAYQSTNLPKAKTTQLNFTQKPDFAQKIVRLDFNQINRSREKGNQLGEHVTVLPKAA